MQGEDKGIKLAYIAGILDGDGSFSLIKEKQKDYAPLYYPLIQMSNSNKEIIDFFIAELGGTVFTRKPHIGKDGGQRIVSYHWKASRAKHCLPIINEISPYLILKKERAEFLRDFILKNPFKPGYKRPTVDTMIEREKAWIKMMNFNSDPYISSRISQNKQRKTSSDPLFWAYLSGLMDTDGSFSIARRTKRSDCKHATYGVVILLSMTDSRAIYHLVNNLSMGRVIIIKSRCTKKGFSFRFGIYKNSDAIEFLEKCIPYLRIKKQTAEIVLNFCRDFNSQDKLVLREKYYQDIRKLSDGVYKSSLIDLEAEGNNPVTGPKVSKDTTVRD